MGILIYGWLTFNALIVIMLLAYNFLSSISQSRRNQFKRDVMTTLRMMRVPSGWMLTFEKEYPHREKFVRTYKLIQVQIKRSAASHG